MGIESSRAYKYAVWSSGGDNHAVGRYVRRQTRAWLDIADGAKRKHIAATVAAVFANGTQPGKLKGALTKANKSGVCGVKWDKSRGKWQASIKFQGHKYNLGRFDEFDDAVKARREAEEKIFGSFLEWYNARKK